MSGNVLFIQGRTHRAGAQTCLARLLRHEAVRAWRPAVLCSKSGWLTEECARQGVAAVLEPFPSSRSLSARLWGISNFAGRVASILPQRSILPRIVHANDHQEGLLALAVARKFNAKTAIVLRSPGMCREDYFKYDCNKFDYISAIGDELTGRVRSWDPSREIDCVYDGVFEEEFLPPKQLGQNAPSRILVIGSPLVWKGWADLTHAIYLLEQRGDIAPVELDFTGDLPLKSENDLSIDRLSSRCNFLGRVEGFRDLVRSYDLVINPSRMETFGMAAVEVIAAGVPLLSSRTGMIEEVQTKAALLFTRCHPASLGSALKNILQNWNGFDFGIAVSQKLIRQKFTIDHAAERLNEVYTRLS